MSDEIVRPDPVGLSHIGISVTDLARSVAFYCDVLGGVVLQPPAQGKSTSSKWRMALVALGSLGLDI